MNHLDPTPDAPASGPSEPRNAKRRTGTRLLTALALLAALVSALALSEASKRSVSAANSPKGVTTLDVADAAAVAATSGVTIEIKNYAFVPASASVPVGTKVTWVNEDTVPHTVTTKSGPASFDSGQVAPGASYSVIFESPGTYGYYCIDHPQMTASITVTGGSGGSPTPSSAASSSSPPAGGGGGHGGGGTGGGTGAPSASATPASSGGMSMSAGPTGGGVLGGTGSDPGCASLSQVLLPLLQHLDTTHLGESPGQQAQDLLNINQYVLTHTTLVENMLVPLWNSANRITTGLLVPLLQHLDTTHLGESPGQQVTDLLNLDQYVLTHTTLVENMIAPTEGVLTGTC
jgi:plastocyanin